MVIRLMEINSSNIKIPKREKFKTDEITRQPQLQSITRLKV